MSRIYVASSWRNPRQPDVVLALRAAAHEVYDFRNPAPGNHGFAWSAIDPEWLAWDARTYRECLDNPVAQEGFRLDHEAMEWADTFVMVQPCGRSAHLELGWACGRGKDAHVLLQDGEEPELMVLEVGSTSHLHVDLAELIEALAHPTD